jgi:hypothetical protein
MTAKVSLKLWRVAGSIAVGIRGRVFKVQAAHAIHQQNIRKKSRFNFSNKHSAKIAANASFFIR